MQALKNAASNIKSIFSAKEKEPKVLSFDEAFVTECVVTGNSVFTWDGTKGPIADYAITQQAGEWLLKVINDSSRPTIGTLVAVPTGKRTAAIFKDAKIHEMMGMGIHNVFARMYLSRTRGVRYAMEPEVMAWVYRNYLMSEVDLDHILGSQVPKGAANGRGYHVTIPQSRFTSAMEIIRHIRRDDAMIYFALNNKMIEQRVLDGIKTSQSPTLSARSFGISHSLSDADILTAIELIEEYNNR